MAARGKQEPKDIKSETLWSAGKVEFQDGQKANEIRVVDWIVNGKHYPKLEKRDFFMGDGGEWKLGKSSGFSLKDINEVLLPNWDEIMRAFGANFATPATSPKAEAAPAMTSAPAGIDSDF